MSSNSKPSAACWALRLKKSDEPNDIFTNVAKFSDPVDWKSAIHPIQMYYKDEEIREEVKEDAANKDSEYFKRKRSKRRMYRKKSFLIMADSAGVSPKENFESGVPNSSTANTATFNNGNSNSGNTSAPISRSSGVRFVGQVCNMGLATDMDQGRVSAMRSDVNANSFPFKYVLLQFTKKPPEIEGGAVSNEINVIPVTDMFLFKKGLGGKDELLNEIDEKFEVQNQQKRAQFAHYKEIFESLKESEARKLQEGDADDDYIGGFESATLFGNAVNKALGGSKKGGNKVQKFKRESGHKHHIEHIDENGVQLDEMNESDEWCKGDYETKFADDEENNVDFEQATLNEREELEVTQSVHIDEGDDGGASGGANGEIDEEEEEEEGEEMRREAEERERTAEENSSGLVDEAIVSSAVEARTMLLHLQQQKAVALGLDTKTASLPASISTAANTSSQSSSVSSSSSTVPLAKSSLKRPRPEEDGTEKELKSVSFSTETVKKEKKAESTATKTGEAVSSGEYTLSEEGVRRYITNKGGRVTMQDVVEAFKHHAKRYSKAEASKTGGIVDSQVGKKRLAEVVKRVADVKEDPILGKAFVLKPVVN